MICRSRCGLTLIEIIVAMLLFAVGLLGLAASSAALARQAAYNSQRTRAFLIARARDETLHGTPCAAASGSDRAPGIVSDWHATPAASHVEVTQRVARIDSRGTHVDVFASGAPCD